MASDLSVLDRGRSCTDNCSQLVWLEGRVVLCTEQLPCLLDMPLALNTCTYSPQSNAQTALADGCHDNLPCWVLGQATHCHVALVQRAHDEYLSLSHTYIHTLSLSRHNSPSLFNGGPVPPSMPMHTASCLARAGGVGRSMAHKPGHIHHPAMQHTRTLLRRCKPRYPSHTHGATQCMCEWLMRRLVGRGTSCRWR